MRNFLAVFLFCCLSITSVPAIAVPAGAQMHYLDIPDASLATPSASAPVPVNNTPPSPSVLPSAVSSPDADTETVTKPSGHTTQGIAVSKDYVLGTGDHILLNVYGEDDISGEYVVGSTGIASIPLIGNVQAAGNTVGQLKDTIRAKLAQGYFKDPKVSIEISNYRPFFILGEVAKPGSYSYVNGMTVLNAVALAGGYTYRASTSRIKIVHANDPSKEEKPAEESDQVGPGDLVRVPERYF